MSVYATCPGPAWSGSCSAGNGLVIAPSFGLTFDTFRFTSYSESQVIAIALVVRDGPGRGRGEVLDLRHRLQRL